MRLSDYVMQRLAEANVKRVFQVTGRGALFLSDALAKSKDLEATSMHHEQSCAFASIGFAEQSGGLGACLVSTGCAATNAITGLLSAWQDGVPCIFISGQNILRETSRFTGIALRTYGQQEADIISMVAPITKFATMITTPEEIVKVMDIALFEAESGRKGPVWIDIPLDLQSAQIEPDEIQTKQNEYKSPQNVVTPIELKSLITEWNRAERPVILIGRGVRASGAESQLINFIKAKNVPLTFTASAPDTYGSENKLSIGSVGAMGCSRSGNFAIQNSDFVLVLGSRLTTLNTGPDFCKFAREAYVAVVDIDPVEHAKETIKIDQFIQSDIGVFLESISSQEIKTVNRKWMQKCLHWKKIFGPTEPEFCSSDFVDLYQLSEQLSAHIPRPSTIVTDSGLNEVILPSNISFGADMLCIHPTSQGAMGFALPAAVGAQSASSGTVLAVIGDGSIMMNLQELQTIQSNNLPVKIIVVNNNVYSIIRRRQRDLFRKRTIGTDPENGVSCPEFSKVSKCFGLKYIKIESPRNLESGLDNMFSYNGPVLCEIMGNVDQSYIEIGQTRSLLDKRFVRRPLEDQKPFLHRDLFLKEMIIEPIDQ